MSDRTQENAMLENVRSAHPQKKQPVVLDLTKDLPSAKELYNSYLKLKDLCTPDSLRQFGVRSFCKINCKISILYKIFITDSRLEIVVFVR